MQDILPPLSWENFGDDDGDPGVRLLVQDLLDVVRREFRMDR